MADDAGQELGRKVQARLSRLSANPFATLVTNLYSVYAIPTPPLPRPSDGKVRIALVSMPNFNYELREFPALRGSAPPGVEPSAYTRRMTRLDVPESERCLAAFREALTYAVDELNANVVCVNELGLPSRDMQPLAAAQAFARSLSDQRKVLIIAGSGHDSRTYFNTGYIFHPGGPASGWAFHKSISATSTGELIAAPSERRIATVETFGFRIATMICLDVADYATFASLVAVADRVPIVLVPCYTHWFEKMAQIARVASRALPGIVALVNADLPNAAARPTQIAKFGEFIRPAERPPLASGACVSFLTVDHDTFEAERLKAKSNADPEIDWLFGSRQIPRIYGDT